MRDFSGRHKRHLVYARPTRQESKRYDAVNDEVLTTHFAVVEKLLREHGIDASRLWNLDETGRTPSRDFSDTASRRRFFSAIALWILNG